MRAQGKLIGRALELSGMEPHHMPAYLRGQAYLMPHRGPKATRGFQEILDHAWSCADFAVGPLAHLQLGRAYAIEGDNAKASAVYQALPTLWKDAYPDIPVLKQAKAEYAKIAVITARTRAKILSVMGSAYRKSRLRKSNKF